MPAPAPPTSTDLRRTLRRLCHELAPAAGNTEPLPLDIKELITHFQKLLAEASAKQRVILVFDALNQFDETDGAHWMNWLPRELPPGVRIIASVIAPVEGAKEHQTLAILRNRQDARVESLKPLNESDTLAIIEGYLKRYSKRLSAEQIAALKEKPASNLPLYVLTALEELRTLGTYEEITDRIRALPGDTRALFGWILTERLARDPGFRDREGRPCGTALVEKFAACLGVSRHGLSPAELTALLDPGDPLGNVAALLRLLRPYLMRRDELLDFYHGQFREAAGDAHLDTPEKQRAAHQSVATRFQAFADPHRDGQYHDANSHALGELPHHQTRAEAWPDLIATLENIFFLEAKVTHGMAFDLVVDFTAAVDALIKAKSPGHERLSLLAEALRRDIHFIARHAQDYPQGLFQCLWNSAWWYDCPEAAGHYVVPVDGWKELPPWENSIPNLKLSTLLEHWRAEREAAQNASPWLRIQRPPSVHLGAGQLAILHGHELWVTSVVYSPDGGRVLSGSDDRTVRVWDALSGQEQAVLHGHEGGVTSVAFSPDGHRVLTGSHDGTMRLWDAQSGRELGVLSGNNDMIMSVAFSPDGGRLLGGLYDNTVRLWDAHNGQQLTVLHGHEKEVTSVAFSPDDSRVISGSEDTTVRLWDAQSGREVAILRGHEDGVRSVAFSPDGSRVASASSDHTVRLWANHGLCEPLAVLRGHVDGVTSVAFSPDGHRVLSGSHDGTIRLWDVQNGRELLVLRGHDQCVTTVAFSRNGRWAVSGSWDTTIRLWDLQGRRELALPYRHDGWICTVAFSSDGRRLLSGAEDKTARLWDTESGRELAVLYGHEDRVRSAEFSPDGRHVVSGSFDKTVRLWDARSGVELSTLRGHQKAVTSVAFSPDGNNVLSGSLDMTIRLWDAHTTRELAVLSGHLGAVLTLAFSLDGLRIVSGSGGVANGDDTVRLWDAQSGRQQLILRGHENPVNRVAFSPDNRFVFSQSIDAIVRVWDAQSGKCLEVLQGRGGEDIVPVAAGAEAFPWRASVCNGETIIRRSAGGRPVGWFPDELMSITTHLDGRLWAGAVGNHLVLLRLEGGSHLRRHEANPLCGS